jgi:hypothetical protein
MSTTQATRQATIRLRPADGSAASKVKLNMF